jgi:hypothetical protein
MNKAWKPHKNIALKRETEREMNKAWKPYKNIALKRETERER